MNNFFVSVLSLVDGNNTGTDVLMRYVQRFYQWTSVNNWGAVLQASCRNRRVCLHFLGSL